MHGASTVQVECPATNNCSYRVKATNGKGSSPASAVKTVAFNQPGIARNVLATVAATNDLNLGSGSPTATVTWDAPATTGGQPVTGYDGRVCTGNCDESDPAWT